MTTFYPCYNLEDPNISGAVYLHIKHLSYRSFITKFGFQFLFKLYKDWIKSKNAILILATEEDKLIGFVLGIRNKDALFSPITSQPFKYIWHVILGILKYPTSLPKLFETLLYKNKSDHSIKSELLVIATGENNRSQGLGSKLVERLNEEFKRDNINEYTVTVHAEMEKSNNFYVRNGMKLLNSFKLYGVVWNEYKNEIK